MYVYTFVYDSNKINIRFIFNHFNDSINLCLEVQSITQRAIQLY